MILTLTIKYLVSWHCGVPSLFVRMTIFSFHGACYYHWQQQLSKLIINIWFIMSSLKYIDQYFCSKVEALFSSCLFIRPLTFIGIIFALCYRKDDYVIEVTHFPCYLPRRLPRLKLCQPHHIVNQVNLEFAAMIRYKTCIHSLS